MNKWLALAAVGEAATGVVLMADPSLVARLLLGAELSGVAVAVGRVAGIGLLSLGLACWPGKETTRPALGAMATYNLLVTCYLLYLGNCSMRYPTSYIPVVMHPCSRATLW